MRYLLVIMRHSILRPHKCRLIMLCFIVVSMKLLRGLGSEGLDEYMSTQYAPVVWVL